MRLDGLAEMAGLTRAELLRMVLSRTSEADLPTGLVVNAERLREAHGLTAMTGSSGLEHHAVHLPEA